jgi:hypothetical protein
VPDFAEAAFLERLKIELKMLTHQFEDLLGSSHLTSFSSVRHSWAAWLFDFNDL